MIQERTVEREHGLAFIVLAYRCAMAEISGSGETYRAGVWEVLETVAPEGEAEVLFKGFFGFVRSLLGAAGRPIAWRSTYCAHLCRDEWLAVSMIDAAQRGDLAALLEFASQLMGPDNLGDALDATQSLAFALSRRGLYLRADAERLVCGELRPQRSLH